MDKYGTLAEAIADEVLRKRVVLDMPAAQLAALAGLSPEQLHRIEAGIPYDEEVDAIAAALDCHWEVRLVPTGEV